MGDFLLWLPSGLITRPGLPFSLSWAYSHPQHMLNKPTILVTQEGLNFSTTFLKTREAWGHLFSTLFDWRFLQKSDRWIKKMWYIYTKEYYSAIKKNEIMPFTETWMDLEIIILSEVRQRKTNIIWYHFYVESKKMIQMNLFTKQIDSQSLKTNLWLPKGIAETKGEIN